MNLIAEHVTMRYFRKSGQANYMDAVRDVSLSVEEGKVTLLTGRSGSGKTTLLHILAGLLKPTEGTVRLLDEGRLTELVGKNFVCNSPSDSLPREGYIRNADRLEIPDQTAKAGQKSQVQGAPSGTDLYSLDDRTLSRLRNVSIGVIPQGRSMVDTLTVRENILLPGTLYGRPVKEETAEKWMDALGIAALRDVKPAELSGGELRRAAIARTLAGDPAVILADEPTGDLDDENTQIVLDLMREEAQQGKAVFIVTHEGEAVNWADRVFRMNGGILTETSGMSDSLV